MSENEGQPTEVESGVEISPEDEQEDSEFQGNDQGLVERLEQAESKAQEHYDAMMRARAELENVTRRAEKKVEDAHKFALERFAQELLPVIKSVSVVLTILYTHKAILALYFGSVCHIWGYLLLSQVYSGLKIVLRTFAVISTMGIIRS